MNMARSLLTSKRFSNDYWVEVVACSFYILNRSPTSSVQGKVPEETWSGQKFSVSHFKVFGCIAYAYILEELRHKLDDRSEKYILIGYAKKSKGYRLYNPYTKKFFISKDVKFLEDKSWHEQETLNGKTPILTIDEQQESEVKIPRLQV